jgi:hypothetical protein
MPAGPEGEVRLRGPVQDQIVRIGEDIAIAVGCPDGRQDGIAYAELLAGEVRVSHGNSPRGLRGIEPQHLFDCQGHLIMLRE